MPEIHPESYHPADAQARHIQQLRRRDNGTEEAIEELIALNAKAARMATVFDVAATQLEWAVEHRMTAAGGVTVDTRTMADAVRAQANWYEDYASALKQQVEYLRSRD